MQPMDTVSDEPTRLTEIVSTLFAGQSGWARSLTQNEHVELLVGADGQDDCAVFRLDGPMELVVGSDYVRGTEFSLYELGYLDYFDVGYYLTMANFSDIAAMGALPIALLSVVRYAKTMSDAEFELVMDGINKACSAVGAPNVGGDIGTAERLILSASALGVVEAGRSLLRTGARQGDRLCITGPTGVAAAAQKYFGKLDAGKKKITSSEEDFLIGSWKRPSAKVKQGRLLSTSGLVTSCQDSSDGLKAGVQTLAERSGIGFLVDEAALPVVDVVAKVAELSDSPLTPLLLGDSVDFQLIFTVPETGVESLQGQFKAAGLAFHEIGVATSEKDVLLRTSEGRVESLPGAAWRHAT